MSTRLTSIQNGLINLVLMIENEIPVEDGISKPRSSATSPTSGHKEPIQTLEMTSFNKYVKFMKKLSRVEIEDSVFVHCALLFKKVMSRRKSTLKRKDILKVFGTCLFISFKFVVDDLLFYVQDYCAVTGMNQGMIEVLEIAILANIIAFDLNFGEEEFHQEKRSLEQLAFS